MRVLVLGAGQEVGRSCVVVRLGGKTLMFDAGMHMGYSDARRFPDFSLLGAAPPGQPGDLTALIDAVLISHAHIDHVGALPYLTEVCGYRGPVVMTTATAALAPLLLEDFARHLAERPGSGPLFGRHHIGPCMARVTALALEETRTVAAGIEVTPYYAGHMLGAAILHVGVGAESIVYTGDFNASPERHLGPARVPRGLAPSLLVCEATYATSLREGRRPRERALLQLVHETVAAGGKVLIPVSAVGRAQELLLLLDEYWEARQLTAPIFLAGGLAARANSLYRLLLNWAGQRLRSGPPGTRPGAFRFARVAPWAPELLHQPGGAVLFAGPGMLQGGTSLEAFKAWAPQAGNLVLLPSYQVAGTLGRRLMAGQRKGLDLDGRSQLDVNCKVHFAPFSAHADAAGILGLVASLAPRHVLLVHGEAAKMDFMAGQISGRLGIPCACPATGEELELSGRGFVTVQASGQLLRRLVAAGRTADARGAQAQQQQQHGIGAAAAAEWLARGDVAQLAAAAVRLAGLEPAQGSAAAPETGSGSGSAGAGLSAAVRAAQLAPWLELLAAAAQQAPRGNAQHSAAAAGQPPARAQQQPEQVQAQVQGQQQTSPDSQQEDQQQQPSHEQQQQQQQQQQQHGNPLAAPTLLGGTAALSQALQQQLQLEGCQAVVDGVLVVRHKQLPVGGGASGSGAGTNDKAAAQPLVRTMQLLPAAEVAAAVGLPRHVIRLACKLRLPAACWQQQRPPDAAGGSEQASGAGDAAAAAAASCLFVAGVLQRGLPAALAQQVQLLGEPPRVALRSLLVQAASGSAACGAQQALRCSWLLEDDAVAQQCLAVLQQALSAGGGSSGAGTCNTPG